jgi:hypothetical protein
MIPSSSISFLSPFKKFKKLLILLACVAKCLWQVRVPSKLIFSPVHGDGDLVATAIPCCEQLWWQSDVMNPRNQNHFIFFLYCYSQCPSQRCLYSFNSQHGPLFELNTFLSIVVVGLFFQFDTFPSFFLANIVGPLWGFAFYWWFFLQNWRLYFLSLGYYRSPPLFELLVLSYLWAIGIIFLSLN